MYNLFVTADCDAWDGKPTEFDLLRCLREYTDKALTEKHADISESSVAELLLFPCLFTCEDVCGKPAKVGFLKQVTRRDSRVRIEYVIDADYPEISTSDLSDLRWDLDIQEWEMNRTHWALKKIDLHAVLAHANIQGITPPDKSAPVDVTEATFDVALSFCGEYRPYARAVADRLSLVLGRQRVFYDEYYKAQLARPNLDVLLQGIYRERSRLIVACLCAPYQEKDWCGIEFKAIREILKERGDSKVMYVRHDAGHVDGVFSTDGYIDANLHTPIEVSNLILERVRIDERKELREGC